MSGQLPTTVLPVLLPLRAPPTGIQVLYGYLQSIQTPLRNPQENSFILVLHIQGDRRQLVYIKI